MIIIKKRSATKKVLKSIASILVAALVWQEVAVAQSAISNVNPADRPLQAELYLKNISSEFPANTGVQRSSYLASPESDRIIFNLQDAHSSYGAQKSLSRMLSVLASNYSVDLIGIEGSSGSVDASVVSVYPDKEVRTKTAEWLTRNTYVSSAELYQMISQDDVEIVGIENPELYDKNLKSYQEIIESQPRIKQELNKISDLLQLFERAILK